MQTFILGFIQKHTPPFISFLIAIGMSTYYLGNIINNRIDSVIDKARQPFYLSVEYTLAKQEEKLAKDPKDLKTTDIELLSILCNADFGERYITKLPPNRRMDAQSTCDEMVTMYKERAH